MRTAIVVGALMALGGTLAAQAPPAQGQAAAPRKGPAMKSAEEQQAFMAIMQAPDADTRIKAAEEFTTKYADSDFRGAALFSEAQAYMQKNDYEHMVIFGERALESNPDEGTKIQDLLMLASGIAQKTREFDLDREEKLAKAEKYAHQAMDELKMMQKPNPNLPDEKWNDIKSDLNAQAHEALGLAAMARKNYPAAITEYKTAVETGKTPDPATQLRLANAYDLDKKYDEAIPILDKLMADPSLPPQIKQLAQAERVRAVQGKGGGAKPAAPGQPAQPGQPAPPASPAQPAQPPKQP